MPALLVALQGLLLLFYASFAVSEGELSIFSNLVGIAVLREFCIFFSDEIAVLYGLLDLYYDNSSLDRFCSDIKYTGIVIFCLRNHHSNSA